MKRLKFIAGILILLVVTGCARYKDIEVGEIQDFSIRGFDENALILVVKVPVHNPSGHKITITDLDARVFMNEQYVGKVNSSEPVILPRKSDEVHELKLKVRLANFLGTAMNMMQLKKGKKVLLRLEGTFVAKSMGLKKKVEIDESREVVI
jgi:LEA14-like dessication related protein